MYTWQWVVGMSRNEQLIVIHDKKPLGFISNFLCETIFLVGT
jgi:hypothetical protein